MNADYLKNECARAQQFLGNRQKQVALHFYEAEQAVINREYALGGDMLHRGFYCPSIIIDSIARNAKRGKLLHSNRAKGTPSFCYGFDESDRLITVSHANEHELIWYENGVEVGITFSETQSGSNICYLSECVYENNRIQSYSFFHALPDASRIAFMTRELYEYTETHMRVCFVQFCNDKPWMLDKCHYEFSIEDGCFITYCSSIEPQGKNCPIRLIPEQTGDGPYKHYHVV